MVISQFVSTEFFTGIEFMIKSKEIKNLGLRLLLSVIWNLIIYMEIWPII